MKPIDYIILGAVALAVTLVIINLVKRKKEGKGGCGCGCASCPSAGSCMTAQKTRRKKTNDETIPYYVCVLGQYLSLPDGGATLERYDKKERP